MRGITLTQPWASLVAVGAKRIETRSWTTSYRGPLAIHAAKGLDPVGGKNGLRDLCATHPFRHALELDYPVGLGPRFYVRADDLPLGAVVATCELVNVVSTGERLGARWPREVYDAFKEAPDEEAFGDYSLGRFAWILDGVERVEPPVRWKGALGLWRVPDELEGLLRETAGRC